MNNEVVLKDAGGVKVKGEHCADWKSPVNRLICHVKVEFSNQTHSPRYDTKRCVFVLPAFNGQNDYTIYLHGPDGAHVVKNSTIFVCKRQNGKPVVATYTKTITPATNQSSVQAVA